jgi:SAM-dependent methyltransferase
MDDALVAAPGHDDRRRGGVQACRDAFESWLADLEARHLADLTFPEVSRALRALSSAYVERRGTIGRGRALEGAGKRAAFALFYGPLHFLLVSEIVSGLPGALDRQKTVVDLGCGTGAAGAAWACACRRRPAVVGIDRHPWTLDEAARTYRAFGLHARTERASLGACGLPRPPASFVAAFAINELAADRRDALRDQLLERANRGDRVLIVEPLAGFVAPWWREWSAAFEARGGRADEWRVGADLPPIVAKLDRAAGLRHRELTGRSIFVDVRA